MPINIETHRNILFQILKDIFSDLTVAPFLGFKGGTAALMFYDLDRFSVDLDFDLLDESKEDQVFERVGELITQYGTVKEATKKRYSIFFLLSYADKAQNIKVEINRRSFGSKFELKTYLGVSMLVMVREDMFAHKLMAMYERVSKTSRDIYDVWFFLKNNWPINQSIVEQRAGMPFSALLQECVDMLEKLPNRRILHGIGELLTERQKGWARDKLRTETIILLRMRSKHLTER